MVIRHDIPLGKACSVRLMRTLRLPDDGREYPLPPGLGSMEAYEVEPGRYVVPMHPREALWLSFDAPYWKPHALRIGIGGVETP